MSRREMSSEDELEMRLALAEVQEAFPNTLMGFLNFAQVCISELIRGNPDINRIQQDICKWIYGGPKFRMVQAQRGQAKTTLTAIYSVFRLIHEPNSRILIVSAGSKMSKEIANFVIQIVNGLDILWMLRPDKNAGDHESVEWYDVHWLFKGTEKSPSVKCMGVDASLQGSRADILIADDCESMKNSRTVMTRDQLEDLTKEFESVCADGDILYLGTPQSVESIYNNLEARGYTIRVWTGRYPNMDELDNYGDNLAPMLKQDMKLDPSIMEGGGMDGASGQPTCPEMFNELLLLEKEISQGKAKFQLQYMLNTTLSDTERYPLKLANLMVADFSVVRGPVLPIWSNNPLHLYRSAGYGGKYKLYRVSPFGYEIRDFEKTVMYIDPAGGGKQGDETGYAVIKLIGAYIYIVAIGGVPGGYEEAKLKQLVEVAKKFQAKTVVIEKNYGNGAHASMLKPLFAKGKWPVTLEEVNESGQKELRIIDVIEPLLSSHRLLICPSALDEDQRSVALYPAELQTTYRFVHQLAMLTRERGCLRHDDRIDALASAIRFVVERLDFDTQIVIEAKRRHEAMKIISEWSDPTSRRVWLTGTKPKGGRNGFSAISKASGSGKFTPRKPTSGKVCKSRNRFG